MQAAEDFELDRQRVQLDRLRRTSGSMAWLQSATDAAHSAILATARLHGATLWTQDEHFEGLDVVRYIPKDKSRPMRLR